MLVETIRVALDATSDSSRNLHLILQLIHNRMRIAQPYPLIFPLTHIQCLARDNVNDRKASNVSLPARTRTNDDNHANVFITFRNAFYIAFLNANAETFAFSECFSFKFSFSLFYIFQLPFTPMTMLWRTRSARVYVILNGDEFLYWFHYMQKHYVNFCQCEIYCFLSR